jgi:hypothetical protein
MEEIKEKLDEELEELQNETINNRRSFLKKVAIGTAFAIPAIQSFNKNDILVKSALAAGSGDPIPGQPDFMKSK